MHEVPDGFPDCLYLGIIIKQLHGQINSAKVKSVSQGQRYWVSDVFDMNHYNKYNLTVEHTVYFSLLHLLRITYDNNYST